MSRSERARSEWEMWVLLKMKHLLCWRTQGSAPPAKLPSEHKWGGEKGRKLQDLFEVQHMHVHMRLYTHTHGPTCEKHEFNSSFYIIHQPRQKRDLSTLNHPNFCNSLDNIAASGFLVQGRIECLSGGRASWYKGFCFLIDWESTSDISKVPWGNLNKGQEPQSAARRKLLFVFCVVTLNSVPAGLGPRCEYGFCSQSDWEEERWENERANSSGKVSLRLNSSFGLIERLQGRPTPCPPLFLFYSCSDKIFYSLEQTILAVATVRG